MPKDADFKRLVRRRMDETGEPYRTSRNAVLEGHTRGRSPANPLEWVEQLADPQLANSAQARMLTLPDDVRRRAALRGLSHESWRVRRRCCQLLDDIDLTDESTQALRNALQDPDGRVRKAALHSLVCVPCKPSGCDLPVREIAESMLDDRDEDVRAQAVGLLGNHLGLDADLLLRRFVDDRSAKVRDTATGGLAHNARRREGARNLEMMPEDVRRKAFERHRAKWIAVHDGRIIAADRHSGHIRRHIRGTGMSEGPAWNWVPPADVTICWVAPQ